MPLPDHRRYRHALHRHLIHARNTRCCGRRRRPRATLRATRRLRHARPSAAARPPATPRPRSLARTQRTRCSPSRARQPDDYIGGRIQRIDLATGEVDVLYVECEGLPLRGPNDLVFDAHGGFWFTDHGDSRARATAPAPLRAPDGSGIREVVFPMDAPNGVGLSPDGSRSTWPRRSRTPAGGGR